MLFSGLWHVNKNEPNADHGLQLSYLQKRYTTALLTHVSSFRWIPLLAATRL